jgi:hypothetical protein
MDIYANPELKKMEKELVEYIDANLIAESIIETLTEEGVSCSVADAVGIWCDFCLCELADAVRTRVEAFRDKQAQKLDH